jgi:hypothetical protein
MPNEVHFRLNEPLTVAVEEAQEAEDDNMLFSVGRKKSADRGNADIKNSGLELDEKLYNYYKKYMNYDEASAKQDAMQLPSVAFDPMNSEIQFNLQEMNEFGYVNKMRYNNQDLNIRLCPNCHKNLVDGAGKYDMFLFSVIGDTNVGKSIYLAVLEAMIEKGPFNASMFFMGTKEEHAYYLGTSREVVQKRKVLDATIGMVPPLTFQLTFDNAASNTRDTALITFCDIAGEKCRDNESLQIYGRHLKASSGMMFLIDPTRFSRVRNTIDEGADIENMYQMEVVSAINRFLISGTYEHHTDIPTAIMITKCDTLKSLGYFQNSEDHKRLLFDPDWNNRHPNYLNMDEITRIHKGVEDFFNSMDEQEFTRKVKDLFTKYSFFINSSLGRTITNDEDVSGDTIKRGNINPYRITEAFYWMLAENNLIPKKLTKVYKNSKTGEEKEVSIYHFTNDAPGYINSHLETVKVQKGIKDSLFGGKWNLIRELHQ